MSDIDWYDPVVCLKRVKEDGYNLKHVKHQTPEIYLAALENNPESKKYILDKDILKISLE